MIIQETSSSENVESIKKVESSCSKKWVLERNEIPPIFGLYAIGHHTRPKNKLRWRFKLMENPQLKDLVINVDEDSSPKGEKKHRLNLGRPLQDPNPKFQRLRD